MRVVISLLALVSVLSALPTRRPAVGKASLAAPAAPLNANSSSLAHGSSLGGSSNVLTHASSVAKNSQGGAANSNALAVSNSSSDSHHVAHADSLASALSQSAPGGSNSATPGVAGPTAAQAGSLSTASSKTGSASASGLSSSLTTPTASGSVQPHSVSLANASTNEKNGVNVAVDYNANFTLGNVAYSLGIGLAEGVSLTGVSSAEAVTAGKSTVGKDGVATSKDLSYTSATTQPIGTGGGGLFSGWSGFLGW